MYVCRVVRRVAVAGLSVFLSSAFTVSAQSRQTAPPSTQTAASHAGHDLESMSRDGSGTSWLPDASPIYARHQQKGPWMLMEHENAFLQFLHDSGDRGHQQAGSINWLMGMAARDVGTGRLSLRGMLSFEPWTIRGCGYPDLLASGEECRGERIHDLQHPHDFPMELTGTYSAPIKGDLRWQAYGGPAGEPALGPVAYPHRISALPNPLAPVSHHWLDSTHIAFGVVTGGIYGKSWKAEGSVFNGREPDEHRTNFDFGALDSVSARFWYLPTPNFAFQVSTGQLNEAEAGDHGGPRSDVTRTTASGTYHKLLADSGVWATTVAWGRNVETGHASNALLIETNLTLRDEDAWYGRFEVAGKTAHDLDVATASEAFTVAKVQGGFTRYLRSFAGFRPGLGGFLAAGIVPEELRPFYGSRVNLGFGVYATIRPAALTVAQPGPGAGGGSMVMVQTAYDPAKLSCSPPIDPAQAASTVYQGRTYYFCTARERDEFLRDPAMSLSMMPPKQ